MRKTYHSQKQRTYINVRFNQSRNYFWFTLKRKLLTNVIFLNQMQQKSNYRTSGKSGRNRDKNKM